MALDMKNIKEYIESGLLEAYVLGATSVNEKAEVEQMIHDFYEIREEVNVIRETVENYSMAHALEPDVTIRPFLMATIDYTERIKKGEVPGSPPLLHEASKITDYTQWLARDDMQLPPDFQDLHARIIGYTPQVLTAIVWINKMAPQEVHNNEYEKFLIIEGTCNITIEEEVYQLVAGDYLAIPLYKNHHVRVSSVMPCKVILQRVAA
jgi:mannose-6-phosphate isomerase-like protein (cupin superfamily)